MQNQLKKPISNRLAGILITASLLLLTPMVFMLFTNEVNWTGFDFFIWGILLFGTGIICEIVLRKVKSLQQRFVLCGIFLVVFFLVWAELAVGIFGTRFAGS